MKVVIMCSPDEYSSRRCWLELVALADLHLVPIVDHDYKILYDPRNGSDAARVGADVNDPARSRIQEGK